MVSDPAQTAADAAEYRISHRVGNPLPVHGHIRRTDLPFQRSAERLSDPSFLRSTVLEFHLELPVFLPAKSAARHDRHPDARHIRHLLPDHKLPGQQNRIRTVRALCAVGTVRHLPERLHHANQLAARAHKRCQTLPDDRPALRRASLQKTIF